MNGFWTFVALFLLATIAHGAYRGLQARFGQNVIAGWQEYRRDLHKYGTTAKELRRARRDPKIALEVDRKYFDWINRKSSSITVPEHNTDSHPGSFS